jgi:CubicO group peptidase (beta-lactamase class C family)
MRFSLKQFVMVFSVISGTVLSSATAFEWTTATPESQGMSSEKLAAMRDDLAARKTTGLLVVRNDKIVCEWYAPGQSAKSKHGTASMAKAVVGGVSLAVAVSDGLITLDDRAAKFVPQWRNDPLKSRITVRQLGSHTAGIADAEADKLPHEKLTGWKGDFWKRLPPPRDPFTIARDDAPVLFAPGTKISYSNPGIAMLTYTVTASLRDAPHPDAQQPSGLRDIRTLLRERVMRPLGVPDDEWSVGYNQTPVVDGLPLVGSWGGGNYTARAAASVGRLMLREGDWDGRRLISADAVRQVTRDVGTPGNCGIGWWSNNDNSYPELPRDAYCGTGAGHQIVLVVPSLNLIAVRNGDTIATAGGEPNAYHVPLRQYLFKPLVDAVVRSVPVRAPEETPHGVTTNARPPLSAAGDGDGITITSSVAPTWKVVIDGKHGGVITELHVPAEGDNLVSNDGSRFEGLCNLLYATFKETGKDESGYVAKGTLYYLGTGVKLSVLEDRPDRIVVEATGRAGNQVAAQKDAVRFRQRYTFLADRIVCDGEVEWLYDDVVPESRPELIQLDNLFTPGAVDGEMRVWDADTGPVALPQTNSKGANYPNGIDYPLTVEVPLRGGHALHFHSLQMPDSLVQARFYYNEYPRQIENKRGFGFKAWEGWPGNRNVRFPNDRPISYRYEAVIVSQGKTP